MKEKDSISNELSEEAIFMIAAETAISTVFDQADDDTRYHHDVSACKKDLTEKKIQANSKDVAESILGWTLVL